MRVQKILSAAVTSALLLSMLPATALAAPADQLAGQWYERAMTTSVERGIIGGDEDGNLHPTRAITRGEMAVMLDRVMDYQTKAANRFGDLSGGAYYTDAILGANAAGILKGDDNGNVNPGAGITRQETAVMLARVMGIADKAAPSGNFIDQAAISPWAVQAVNAMKAAGYMGARETSFRPQDPITRAEVATVLSNIFEGYYNKTETYSADVTGSAVVNAAGATLKNMKVGGDLIIAEGVADGNVYLDGVTIGGRLLVRGGGVHSIYIRGASQVGNVILARLDGAVRVVVEGGAKVEVVVVDDGSDAVRIDGAVDALHIAGEDVAVEVTGKVGIVTMEAGHTKLTVSGSVDKVETTGNAPGAVVETTSTGKIAAVEAAGAGTQVTGSGKVDSVAAKADDVKVTTPNTKVEAAPGTTGVTAGDKPVAGGSVVTTPGSPAGGGGGGSYVPPVNNVANVSNLEGLKAALADASKTTINITEGFEFTEDVTIPAGKTVAVASGKTITVAEGFAITVNGTLNNNGTVGSAENYVQYILNESAAVRGGTFYGSLLVKGDGVTIDAVTVYNKGDETGNTWNRAGVYAYCDSITITGSTFRANEALETSGGISNGVVILPKSNSEKDYSITGNTFDGYSAVASGYSSGGLMISGGITKEYLGMENVSVPAELTEEQDLALITLNTFDNCKNDYQRDFWENGTTLKIQSKSTSSGSNLLLGFAADTASYYITGNIAITGTRTIPEGTTFTIMDGIEVTIETGAITINGTLINNGKIGSTSNYIQYYVNENAAVENGTFYGSLLVMGDGVTIDSVHIHNKGDVTGESTWNRAAVYAYCDSITIKDSIFNANTDLGAGICNGVVLLPESADPNYTLTGNTFNGYVAEEPGYSSVGMTITSGIIKEFLGMSAASVAATGMTDAADRAIITGNIFESCTGDYVREDWSSGNKIYCKSVSHGSNLTLQNASTTANYYITGDVVLGGGPRTVQTGTTLTVMEGAILTIGNDTSLTVNGQLVNKGSVIVNGTLVISDTEQLAGEKAYTIDVNGTLKFGTVEYISSTRSAIAKLSGGSVSILGNAEGGYTVTIPSGTTLTIQNRNSTSGDYYHHGTNDVIVVEQGGALAINKNFGNNGMIEVHGTLTVDAGASIFATANEATKTIKVFTGATVPSGFAVPAADYTSHKWDGNAWTAE